MGSTSTTLTKNAGKTSIKPINIPNTSPTSVHMTNFNISLIISLSIYSSLCFIATPPLIYCLVHKFSQKKLPNIIQTIVTPKKLNIVPGFSKTLIKNITGTIVTMRIIIILQTFIDDICLLLLMIPPLL